MSGEQFKKEDLEPVKKLLREKRKVVITTHHRPDGDAMGSSLGLYNYLVKKGHECVVIPPSSYPDFLAWLPGHERVLNFETSNKEGQKEFQEADIIFCLDFNRADRTNSLEEILLKSSAIKILIDHHLDPGDFADHIFCYPEVSSTAELIYKFIVALDDKNLIDKNIAECLYTGIMTDTGSFRYSSTTAETHRILANLMDAGAVNYIIHENVYDDYTENRVRLLGYCIKDKMEILSEYKTAIIALSDAELKKFDYKEGDTEGIVNFPLSIRNVILSAFFTERDRIIRLSFRSQGEFSVKELSREHFNGGGHRNAAGGKSELSLEDTIQKFKDILPQYKQELINAL